MALDRPMSLNSSLSRRLLSYRPSRLSFLLLLLLPLLLLSSPLLGNHNRMFGETPVPGPEPRRYRSSDGSQDSGGKQTKQLNRKQRDNEIMTIQTLQGVEISVSKCQPHVGAQLCP